MAEIRLRDISKDLEKTANQVAAMLHEKTIAGATAILYGRFLDDQKTIRELQARNTQLHAAIAKYYNKEDKMKDIIQQFISNNGWAMSEAKKTIKHFGTKRNRRQ